MQLGVANKKATQVLFYSRKNFLLHPINLWDATESFPDMYPDIGSYFKSDPLSGLDNWANLLHMNLPSFTKQGFYKFGNPIAPPSAHGRGASRFRPVMPPSPPLPPAPPAPPPSPPPNRQLRRREGESEGAGGGEGKLGGQGWSS